MNRPPFTFWEILQALTVDLIRRLWDDGQQHDNQWLRDIHANWFQIWVDWKTATTMSEVDSQARDIVAEWDAAEAAGDVVFAQELKGETPLGGEMRLRGHWVPPGGA